MQLGEHKDFIRIGHLSECTDLWMFSDDPTLFDGDYFWYTKHDVSQSGISLLHFEWAFLIW